MSTHPGCSRQSLAVAAGCAALAMLCPSAQADPPAPTTAPDASRLLAPDELERIQRIADQLGRRRWGPPIIERFDQPVEPGKDPWKVQGAKLTRKDGRLCVEMPANRQALVWAERPISPQIHGAEGVRIDAWVDLGQVAQPFPRAALYLTTDKQQAMRWDYAFYFAYTNTNMQRLQVAGRFEPVVGTVQPRDKEKVHVAMELFNRRVRCWYDGQLVADQISGQPVKSTPRTMVGFTCMSDSVRVIQLSLRPLADGHGAADPAELARVSSFKDVDELTGFLIARVVPRLGSADFTVRCRTSRLLESLMPLAGPAVRSALPAAADPEIRIRLEHLVQFAGMSEVAPPTDLKPPGEAKGPEGPASTTTQPEGRP